MLAVSVDSNLQLTYNKCTPTGDAVLSDLSTLSAPKLHAVIAKRDTHWKATLDRTIAAGMGDMRFSDIVELAKGSSLVGKTLLARDYLNARHDWRVAMDELDARRTYHGGDKPIKRRA
jgi:hypothetical protein